MDFQYFWKLFVKVIGFCFYIVFQIMQLILLLGLSICMARYIVQFIAWVTNSGQIDAQYEALFILGLVITLKQHYLLSSLDKAFILRVSVWFEIFQNELKFWVGVFEMQIWFCTQIMLGPILMETHNAPPTTFENGPMSTFPLDPGRQNVFMYLIILAMILSIVSGWTGCAGLCRSVGGETGCFCQTSPDSLGYTSFSYQSVLIFLALLFPNFGLVVAYGLFLNGFYSVGCVVGSKPMIIFYWLIFAAVLLGVGAGVLEYCNPFPKAAIKPPFFVFVNHLKAQSYILHYIVSPSLVFPLFNDKKEIGIHAQNDNFRGFVILVTLNVVLQIKLAIALVRLDMEIQKCLARLIGLGLAPRQIAQGRVNRRMNRNNILPIRPASPEIVENINIQEDMIRNEDYDIHAADVPEIKVANCALMVEVSGTDKNGNNNNNTTETINSDGDENLPTILNDIKTNNISQQIVVIDEDTLNNNIFSPIYTLPLKNGVVNITKLKCIKKTHTLPVITITILSYTII